LAVWRDRSFSRAAEQLNISQSSISMQVKLLEDELGFQLFERTGQGVEATAIGRSFLKQAEQVMVAMLGLADVADSLRGGQTGSLAVGLSSGITSQVLPPLSDLLTAIRAQLRIEIVTSPTRRIQEMVSERRLDIGLVVETGNRGLPAGLLGEQISRIDLALATPAQHPLGLRHAPATIEDIASEPIIMNEFGVGYGEIVLSMFSDRGLKPKVAAVVDNIDTMKVLVASGFAVAILPTLCIRNELELGQIRSCPLNFAPPASIMLVRRAEALPPLTEQWIERLSATLRASATDFTSTPGSQGRSLSGSIPRFRESGETERN
jgi:DNA-binding transcriptional LysR family regulator